MHYLTRDCAAIKNFTDGHCSTITEDMVPPLGDDNQGLFAAAVRSYVRPGTHPGGALSSDQPKPMILRFAQP